MITCQKGFFRIPDEVSYLNCAYMSPLMRAVEEIGIRMIRRKSLPFEIQVTDFFEPLESLKKAFARLINVPEPGRIATIPSVSYGMANIARNLHLQPGDRIVVAEEQFPSNIYPWQRLAEETGAEIRIVPAPVSKDRTTAWNESLLTAIDDRTAMLALSHVHWADGTLFDLKALRQKTKAHNALLVLDGTQSVGALPFDVAEYEPDALICAGYKWLMGPYSIGLAYYGPAFDGGVPVEENWINRLGSEDFQNLVHYQPEYQPLAGRYSVGEQSNFILVPMMEAALQQILSWQPANIQVYCRNIATAALDRLTDMGCQLEAPAQRADHLFGIRIGEHFDEKKLKANLQREQVFVSFRGSAIRVAPHVYNSEHDFQRLVRCFEDARKKVVF